MNVLFAVSEAAPFAKTGGLADVAGSLPRALAHLGHDVRLILPRYRCVDRAAHRLKAALAPWTLSVGGRSHEVSLWQGALPNVNIPVYFLEQPRLFDRDGLYQDRGGDFPDNLERFSVFSLATLEAIKRLGWTPDILHCHDWQTALICAHRGLTLANDPFWRASRTVLTIHNLAYQGLFARELWPLTGLPDEAFRMEGLEFYGKIDCLKGGLVYADALTTVSPTYANEIQTPEFGCGLEGVLIARRRDLVGILNGIDPDEWNPATSPHLAARYSAQEPAGKSLCKLRLQEQQRLPAHHVLLIGMIQRLAEQKGIDLLLKSMDALLRLPIQLVILGTGEPAYERRLAAVAKRHPQRVALTTRFDHALAHRIEAGADAFLMPSRFEPCGLNQMYSMRYGTVPIVRRVGGLADTVVDVSPSSLAAETATGFVFDAYTTAALLEAVQRAVAAFAQPDVWGRLVQHGMRQDFSWTRSAQDYVRLYERLHALRDDRHRYPEPIAG